MNGGSALYINFQQYISACRQIIAYGFTRLPIPVAMDICVLKQFILTYQAFKSFLADKMIWDTLTFTRTWGTGCDRWDHIKIHTLLLERVYNGIFPRP